MFGKRSNYSGHDHFITENISTCKKKEVPKWERQFN
jgi:hypothetical protein